MALSVPAQVCAAGGQTWPAFALVAGLLLIGRIAADDEVFAAAGSRIAALPGGPAVMLAGLLGLVAVVTVVLNLDTSVVLLTPVVLEAARARGVDERPFLYGALLMSNSASLLLPGSNLTNLLVQADTGTPGHGFALRMLAPWLAAVTVTWLGLWRSYRRELRGRSQRDLRPVSTRGVLGMCAIGASAVLVLALPRPALPVLCLGVGATAVQRLVQGHAAHLPVRVSLNPMLLGALFTGSVMLGTLARTWSLPGALMHDANPVQSMMAGVLGALLMTNLPAAVLLGSSPPAHPSFLLVGLDLGPNLAITGSLSAILWLQVARRYRASASALTYSKLGLTVGALALVAAVGSLALVSPSG